MSLRSGLAILQRVSIYVSRWFNSIAIASFMLMIAVTFVDVVGAKVFGLPLKGSFEIVALVQIIAITGALAYTQVKGMHVKIDIVIDRLPKWARLTMHCFNTLLGLGIFTLLGVESFRYGISLKRLGEVSGTLIIPHYPFALWIALSCIPMGLVLLAELLNSYSEARKK